MSEHPSLGDRYVIDRELGRGGMAVVYLAQDRKHSRAVAVKVMHPAIAAALGTDRFLREIDIAARLQHPHIVGLIDSGETVETAPRPFYVMPFVEGETLRHRLERERQLTLVDALQLTREIAGALSYAHGRGVVHRDMKPENVLLADGHAMVTDFGIARALQQAGGDRLTMAGMSLGTPAYMSPEQVGGALDADARSDQYSLACVLYEMLAGGPPFTGATGAQVMARHVVDPVPPLTTVRRGVPPNITRSLDRALAKTPADRFPDLAVFTATLDTAAPAPAPPRPSIVVLPFANVSPDPDTDFFADGLTEEVIADLTNLRALRVIARNSAMRLKGTDKDAPTLGRELDVRYVLAGSVRRAGPQLRITAQLAETAEDRQVWAGKFGGTVDDVFDLQERLAREIVDALRVTISPDEDRKLAARTLDDFAVVECYQRVRQEIYKFTDESVDRAIRLAREGLATLGESELLLSALCHALIGAEWIGREDQLAEADRCVTAIFAKWPGSAYGHLLRGAIEYRRGHPRAAIDALEQARASRRNDPDVLIYLSVAYWLAGRSAPALQAITEALAVDPLNPVNWNMSGLVRLFDGDLAGSITEFRRGAALGPDTPMCHCSLALALMIADRDDEAAPIFDDLALRFPTDPYRRLWSLVWHGRRSEIDAVRAGYTPQVVALARVDEGCTYCAAAACALIGDQDAALRWFEHMMRDRGFFAYRYFAELDPFLASLRGNRRYQALLSEMKEKYQAFGA